MKYKNVLMLNNKKKMKEILSSDRFVPAPTLPKVFVGMMDGDLIFADLKKLEKQQKNLLKK